MQGNTVGEPCCFLKNARAVDSPHFRLNNSLAAFGLAPPPPPPPPPPPTAGFATVMHHVDEASSSSGTLPAVSQQTPVPPRGSWEAAHGVAAEPPTPLRGAASAPAAHSHNPPPPQPQPQGQSPSAGTNTTGVRAFFILFQPMLDSPDWPSAYEDLIFSSPPLFPSCSPRPVCLSVDAARCSRQPVCSPLGLPSAWHFVRGLYGSTRRPRYLAGTSLHTQEGYSSWAYHAQDTCPT